MRADLNALLTAAHALFPADPKPWRGRPQKITDNELLCLMCAQMLLQLPCPSDPGERIESVINTLKDQLLLDQHRAGSPRRRPRPRRRPHPHALRLRRPQLATRAPATNPDAPCRLIDQSSRLA